MKEKLFTLLFMAGVAALFTTGVSAVHMVTRRRVELNRELAEKRVVLDVLDVETPKGAQLEEIARIYEKHIVKTDMTIRTETGTVPLLKAVTEDGEPMGYVFKVAGRGFWDTVRGYMAVEPDLKTIRGLSFYEQSETPGLGAEITKEWFEKQFEGLVIPDEAGRDDQLVGVVRPEAEAGPHEVHGITGATGTSNAVERLLNNTLRAFQQTVRSERGLQRGS